VPGNLAGQAQRSDGAIYTLLPQEVTLLYSITQPATSRSRKNIRHQVTDTVLRCRRPYTAWHAAAQLLSDQDRQGPSNGAWYDILWV